MQDNILTTLAGLKETVKSITGAENEALRVQLEQQIALLEQTLQHLASIPNAQTAATKLQSRLNTIRHVVSDSRRFNTPYVLSPELESLIQMLEITANLEQDPVNGVILQGPPGTGKTQLPYHQAAQAMERREDVALIHIRLKTEDTARSLLYSVDHVRRLSDAQTANLPDDISADAAKWRQRIASATNFDFADSHFQEFMQRLNAVSQLSVASQASNLNIANYIELGPLGEAIRLSATGKKVFLILDELEKSGKAVIDGILGEMEDWEFNITETGEVVKGKKGAARCYITANIADAHKLGEALRRRFLFQYVPNPDKATLEKIIQARFGDSISPTLFGYAVQLFQALNAPSAGLKKPPSIPEILTWLELMIRTGSSLSELKEIPFVQILIKEHEDMKLLDDAMKKTTHDNEGYEFLPDGLYAAAEAVLDMEQRGVRGYRVLRLPDLNVSYTKPSAANLYKALHDKGLRFSTHYSENRHNHDNERPFNLYVDGFRYLGNDIYLVPADVVDLFLPLSDSEIVSIHNKPEITSIQQASDYALVGASQYNGKDVPTYRIEIGDHEVYLLDLPVVKATPSGESTSTLTSLPGHGSLPRPTKLFEEETEE